MIKTAYNHIISESLDFGCAIFDADVQMIAQGIGLPVFQGHLGFPIEATIRSRAGRLPRGRRLHPQRSLRRQRQPPQRRGHDRAGVLGGPADRLRLGEGALERRGRAGAEQHAGGLARVPPGGAALSVGAPVQSWRAERRGHADDPRQHPHRERHAEGRPGHDRRVPHRRGLVPRDPRQVRPRDGARRHARLHGAVRAPHARGTGHDPGRRSTGRTAPSTTTASRWTGPCGWRWPSRWATAP